MLPISCLIYSILVFLTRVSGGFELAPDLHLDSQIHFLVGDKAYYYEIQEFLQRDQGSIKLAVSRGGTDGKKKDSRSYYRLNQPTRSSGKDLVLEDEKLVAYDDSKKLCSEDKLDSWLLKDYSRMLAQLQACGSQHVAFNTSQLRDEPTALGSAALMQLIYDNADQFTLDAQVFDQVDLADVFYFATKIDWCPRRTGGKTLKIFVSFMRNHVDAASGGSDELKVGSTKLSQVSISIHPSKVLLLEFDQNNRDVDADFERLMSLANIDGIIVRYLMVRQYSLNKHNLDLTSGFSSYEAKSSAIVDSDPLVLPSGAGCGRVSSHRPLLIGQSGKFSGRFTAMDTAGEFYVAFDEATSHLRHDSIGQQTRTIFDLRESRATLISSAENSKVPAHSTTASHCSESYFRFESTKNGGIFEARSMLNVLGLSPSEPLHYLGHVHLNDFHQDLYPIACHAFERELKPDQIPSLLRLHMRIQLPQRPAAGDRFFLLFYLVDEHNLAAPSDFMLDPGNLWLKRIELLYRSDLMTYKVTYAQLTFARFSWTLATPPTSELAKHLATGESSLRQRSVQIFDTNECKSAQDQDQLELVIGSKQQQQQPSSGSAVQLGRHLTELSAAKENLEEIMIEFLAQRLDLSRSLINELELELVARPSDSRTEQQVSSSGPALAVRAKLNRPMRWKLNRFFVGWLDNVQSLLLKDKVKLIRLQTKMLLFECTLTVGQILMGSSSSKTRKIQMVLCPNHGCGYIEADDLESLEFRKSSGLEPDNQKNLAFDSCEIHSVIKDANTEQFDSSKYTFEVSVRVALDKSPIWLTRSRATENQSSTSDTSSTIFDGQVTSVWLSSGKSADSTQDALVASQCFDSSLLAADKQTRVKLVEVQLEAHMHRVQCHKSCMLQAACRSYSYDHSSRRCTTSNLGRDFILATRVRESIGMRADARCDLYALNSAALFTVDSLAAAAGAMIEYATPAGMLLNTSANKSKLLTLSADLMDCANLCHSNEVSLAQKYRRMLVLDARDNQNYRCASFKYLRLKSLCTLQIEAAPGKLRAEADAPTGELEQQFELVNTLDRMREFVGQRDLYVSFHVELHRRNFEQFYSIERSRRLNLAYSSSELTKRLLDLSFDACARQCTLVERNCLALDFCMTTISGTYTRLCQIYHFRSPFALGATAVEQFDAPVRRRPELKVWPPLDAQERLLYETNDGQRTVSVAKFTDCRHLYLSGDYLYLKRQMSGNKFEQNNTESMQPAEPIDEISSSWSNLEMNSGGLSSGVAVFSQLVACFAIGLMAFVYQPTKMREYSTDLVRNLGLQLNLSANSMMSMGRRRRRSDEMEINEMNDIDESWNHDSQ